MFFNSNLNHIDYLFKDKDSCELYINCSVVFTNINYLGDTKRPTTVADTNLMVCFEK